MDIDVDENILDPSVLDLLYHPQNQDMLKVEDISDELNNPNHKMMSPEQMDKYIRDFLEQNKGEESPVNGDETLTKEVCLAKYVIPPTPHK